MEVERGYRSDSLFNQASEASNRGQHHEAVRSYEALVRKYPAEPLLETLLASAYSKIGRNDLAITHFQHALGMDHLFRPAWEGLGYAHQKRGELQEAETALRSAIAVKPLSYNCVLLAAVLIDRKQFEEALEYCQKALQINPAYEEAYLNLGVVFKNQERHPEAIAALTKSIELDPHYTEAYYVLGMTYYAEGKYSFAESALRQALNQKSDHVWSIFYLALTLWQMKRFNEAEIRFHQAMDLSSHPIILEHYLMFCEAWRQDEH